MDLIGNALSKIGNPMDSLFSFELNINNLFMIGIFLAILVYVFTTQLRGGI